METKKNKLPIAHSLRFYGSHLVLAFIIALFVVGFVTFTQAKASAETATDTKAIKSIVMEAFAAPVTLVVIPETSGALPAGLTATTAPALSTSIKMQATLPAIKTFHAYVQQRFNKIYAPDSLIGHNLYGEIQNSVEGQSKGRYRALGGGIQDIDWRNILINGDQASVTVAATLWSHLKYTDELGKVHFAAPTTGYVKVYTLKKISNQWLISSVVDDNLQADQLKVNHQVLPPASQKPVVPTSSANKVKA